MTQHIGIEPGFSEALQQVPPGELSPALEHIMDQWADGLDPAEALKKAYLAGYSEAVNGIKLTQGDE